MHCPVSAVAVGDLCQVHNKDCDTEELEREELNAGPAGVYRGTSRAVAAQKPSMAGLIPLKNGVS